ncbi:uncharacterized protein LOC130589639 [Beta vulgaris subsp. vulgaris]|uniref:uncharacterized protein LOC130589639 n=1 Tax=Beta vulgaris subsp. vulgaris TaxID=3555 RepID=UPI0025470B3A|nr:uncharacterized protein LOC130589639 [Beta vulgaris subsp. vulgaris]
MIYREVLDAVSSEEGGVFFVYGYGGTGKTYVWKTLCAAIRKKGEIILPVASSGIVSLLLPRGRTTHSRFGIPLNVNENSTFVGIRPGSELAALLIKTKLIIWDEAPMMHKYCFEALDRSLRDIMRSVDRDNLHRPFGGKVIVLGGDLRQILPVVPKGSRQDIVFTTVNSSYLWDSCKVLRLTRNMRLQPVHEIYSTEFLNTIKCSGLPNHSIRLKVGAPVMLQRNIDQTSGLCNGTRLVVNHLGNRVIEATVISGSNVGAKVFIPRMKLTPSDSTKFPIRFQRCQFPLMVYFAMTINKSQGQSLSHVGLYLPRPVFSHGQFYVAVSKVTSKKDFEFPISLGLFCFSSHHLRLSTAWSLREPNQVLIRRLLFVTGKFAFMLLWNVRRIEEWRSNQIVKGRGRPKMTWLRVIESDMRLLGIEESMTLDRSGWRGSIYVEEGV